MLTALSAVVVVLTRLRMRGGRGPAGSRSASGCSTCTRSAACSRWSLWTVFLVAAGGLAARRPAVGIIGLGLYWIVAVAGLLILVRWLPSHGRHASEGRQDTWSEGPGLSVLAHVGMLVGVILFTCAYLTSVVTEPRLVRTSLCRRWPLAGLRRCGAAAPASAARQPPPAARRPCSSTRVLGKSGAAGRSRAWHLGTAGRRPGSC